MKILKYSALLSGLLVLAGCGGNFVKQELDDRYQLAAELDPEYGVPIRSYHSGVFEDFAGPIYSWWTANDKLQIRKQGDTLRIDLKDCGVDWECWGREMELLDFSEAPVLRVRARAEGNTTPTIGISLKDVDGYDTNKERPSERIMPNVGYMDYYFNFEGKWIQTWPDNQEVKADMIREILFFVNPGGPLNWTGTIYIDEIEAIPVEEMPSADELRDRRRRIIRELRERERAQSAQQEEQVIEAPVNTPQQANAVMIADFKGGAGGWVVSEDDKISVSEKNNNLVVDLNKVGEAYEFFGKGFDAVNFVKTPVLHLRIKSEGKSPDALRVDIKDVNGFETNSLPNVKKVQIGTDFVDLYYDFTDKFEQEYPNVQRVDPEHIVEVLLMVNPGGPNYSGTIVIDQIRAISLDDYNKLK